MTSYESCDVSVEAAIYLVFIHCILFTNDERENVRRRDAGSFPDLIFRQRELPSGCFCKKLGRRERSILVTTVATRLCRVGDIFMPLEVV